MKKQNRKWTALGRRGLASLLVAVMMMGFIMPVYATGDVTEPTEPAVTETTAATEPETTAAAQEETTEPASSETSEPATSETTEPASSETSEPASSETTVPPSDEGGAQGAEGENTTPQSPDGDSSPDKGSQESTPETTVPDATVPQETTPADDQLITSPAPDFTAYDRFRIDLAAMEEEAKTLEATEEVLDEFYNRLFDIINAAQDEWEKDTITNEEMDALNTTGYAIMLYLKDTYGYENGEILALANVNVDNIGITPINATVKVFNYDATVNTAEVTKASDGKPIFPFKHNYVGDTKDGIGDSGTARHNTNRRSGSGTGFGIARKLNNNGYPVVTNWIADGDSWKSTNNPNLTASGSTIIGNLDYLFSESSSYFEGKSTNGAGLFQDIGNGFVEYDSYKNAAWFNTNTDSFVLYNELVRPQSRRTTTNSIYYGNFLPFNDPAKMDLDTPITWDGKTSYNIQAYKDTASPGEGATISSNINNQLDMWFGMTVEFDFAMPKDGLVNGEVMQFDFTGDDDVYVFIDDVMILNIGGSHEAQRAWINFRTGEVYDQLSSLSGNLNTTDASGNTVYATTTIRDRFEQAGESTVTGFNGDTFADHTTHTLKFFYLERGGCDSSCRLKFNIQTLPENSLTVAKDVKNDPKDTEFRFQAVLKNDKGQPLKEVYYYLNGKKQDNPMKLKDGGIAEFKLGDGDNITFELAVGYTYDVKELDANKNGYLTTPPAEESGTLNDQDTVYLTYVNDLQPGAVKTNKTVSEVENDQIGDYILTLDAFATGTTTTLTEVKPADIVVVFDESGSMVNPQDADVKLGEADMRNSETHKANAINPLYYYAAGTYTNAFIFYYQDTWMLYDTGTDVSSSGGGGWRNVIHSKEEIMAAAAEVISTDRAVKLSKFPEYPENKVGWTGTYGKGEPKVAKMTELNWDIFTEKGIWQTRYGAVYDALKEFVTDLSKETESDHRIAIVGFGGPDEYGTALFVDGVAFQKNSLTENQLKNAFMDADAEFDQVMASINALHTGLTLTYVDSGLDIAKAVYDNNPIDSTKRDRIAIVFSDGQTMNSTAALASAQAVKDQGAVIYSVATGTAYASLMSGISSNTATDTRYYLRADTATELKNAFNKIMSEVSGSNIVLDEKAILRDTISGYFKINDDIVKEWEAATTDEAKSDVLKKYIAVSTDKCIEITESAGTNEVTYTFANQKEPFNDAFIRMYRTGTDDLFVIEVSGFDYADNHVAKTDGDVKGSKLIVEIPIEIADSNTGGNKQPTNIDENTGIYDGNKQVTDFDLPHVDTPVDVTVKKKVTGNMGDWSKEFTFTATVTEYTKVDGKYYDDVDDNAVGNSNYLDASERVQEVTYSDDAGSKYPAFKLKNYQDSEKNSFTIPNLYYGSKVTISEFPENYTLTVNGEEIEKDADGKATFIVDKLEGDMTIEFVNDYEVTIDTGIALDSLPYILILAVVVVGGAVLFLRKRKNAED